MIRGDGNIVVSRSRDRILISRVVTDVAVPEIPGEFTDPYLGLGFYSYRSGQNVVISQGNLRVVFAGSSGGGYATLDSGIPAETITGLTPGETGYLVFRYGQVMGESGIPSTGRDGDVDFGDPSGNYFVSETGGFDTSNGESTSIVDRQGNLARYAYVWTVSAPQPSSEYFQSVICQVVVSPAGSPTVRPIHMGDLLVPLGYTGKAISLSIGLND